MFDTRPIPSARSRSSAEARAGQRFVRLGCENVFSALVLSLQLVAASSLAAGSLGPPSAESDRPQRQSLTVFDGTALDEEGRLVYTERHEVVREDDEIVHSRTEYRAPDGSLIATLVSDYSRDPFVPEYVFHDLRSGKTEGLRCDGDAVIVYHRDAAGKEIEEKRLDRREDMVGGQGFNNWVVERLDELSTSEPLTFRLVIPHRLGDAKLRVKAIDGSETEPVLTLKGEIDNWFLRLVAPSIEISYDQESGRLVRYEGNSNLVSSDGDSMWVQISYEYDTRLAAGEPSAPGDS